MRYQSMFTRVMVGVVSVLVGALVTQSAQAEILFFNAELDGSQEVQTPAVVTNATGTGIVQFDTVSRQLTVDVVVRGLSLSDLRPVNSARSAGHLHNAGAGSNGSIFYDILQNATAAVDTTSGFFVHSESVVDSTVASIIEGGVFYINFHTFSFPAGEIRGDISAPVVIIPAIPEPSTVALMGIGVALLATVRRRRRVLA